MNSFIIALLMFLSFATGYFTYSSLDKWENYEDWKNPARWVLFAIGDIIAIILLSHFINFSS